MAEITGIIQKIEVRDVAGGKKAYNIVVGGQSYGAGLFAPKAQEGDYVKFGLDESRGYKNVERGTLKVSKNKPPAEAVAQAEATKPLPVANPRGTQDTISRQSAANTALGLLTLLSANDALSLPKSEAKGGKAKAVETLLAKYTEFFYEQNTGEKWTNIAPGAVAEEAEGPGDSEEEAADAGAPADSEWD